MKLNEIRDNEGARKSRTRVCRGIGCGKGKTGGRGMKGQKSRTGVAINGFEGGQMPIYRRLPMRGFKNPSRLNFVAVNLGRIQAALETGSLSADKTVDAVALMEAGIIRRAKDGVRLLGQGELKAKINVCVAGISKSAKEAVEKLGGTVTVLEPACGEKNASEKAE
jgi:large subunit ribosomal protein L15